MAGKVKAVPDGTHSITAHLMVRQATKAIEFYQKAFGAQVLGVHKTPDGKVIGNRTKIKVVKNKVAPPFTECEFDIMYDEGISQTGSLIDLGVEHKVLEKKGAWIAYNGELVGQGREAAKDALAENPELMAKIKAEILARVNVIPGTTVAAAVTVE